MRRTKAELRRKNNRARLPTTFKPRFWEMVDGRLLAVKYITRLIAQLEEDANCDSVQKSLLAQRAAFLSLLCQTQEINHVEGNEIDLGSYTQQVNALSGLLTKLGLKKQIKPAADLQQYIEGEDGEDGEWQ